MRVQKYGLFLAVLFATLVSTAQPGAQSVPVTLVKAGRLLDPRTGNVLAPATVLIEGDKIKQVGLSSQIGVPASAKIIDLAWVRSSPEDLPTCSRALEIRSQISRNWREFDS
jgi:hypothetical protein